ncbi:hypothetical protein GCM10025872_26000 [Barrientosiimonas endolithica]|uniref:Uncharacterized protein n=1 Tax=Barrientosiimonas endolithica TaxID=1535208 RepID=A0ABN6YU45_9MICO|nr:hypothetical protein GCM10025872_26000 [Barrientosiimonas endolithica]
MCHRGIHEREQLGAGETAEREVDDLGAAVGRPADAGGDVGVGAAAVLEHLHRQDARVGCDPRDPDAVVAHGRDRAGDVGAVHVGVLPDAVDALPVAVAARLLALRAAGERRALQQAPLQVGLAEVDARVDDRDGDPLTGGRGPYLLGARHLQTPQLGVERVVGRGLRAGRGGDREQGDRTGGEEGAGGAGRGGGHGGTFPWRKRSVMRSTGGYPFVGFGGGGLPGGAGPPAPDTAVRPRRVASTDSPEACG